MTGFVRSWGLAASRRPGFTLLIAVFVACWTAPAVISTLVAVGGDGPVLGRAAFVALAWGVSLVGTGLVLFVLRMMWRA